MRRPDRLRRLFLPALLGGLLLAATPIQAQRHVLPVSSAAPGGRGGVDSTASAADSTGPVPPAYRFQPRRFWPVVGAFVAVDATVLYGLNQLWYSDEGHTSFHWYRYADSWLDDWDTYVQQDKVGHLFVSFHLARVIGTYGAWAGMSPRQAGLFGGTMSALFQSQVEIFDGFSEEYGASRTDILANVIGGALGGAQVAYPDQLDWFTLKYSYHPSPYYDHAVSSNEVLTYLGNVLKDYDGISYWLVVRPERLLHASATAWWPDWLAFSVGYSGDGLAHAVSGHAKTPEHRRQLFVSLDLDLAAINNLPQPFRAITGFFSFIRIPAPALLLTPEARWYWLYY